MCENPLNKLYSRYKNREVKRKEFEGLVFKYYLANQKKTNLAHWKDDEYEDYLSSFYPRLHKAIDSYKETNAAFDVFMGSVFNKSAKEYRSKTVTRGVIENYAWSIHVPEMYAYEEPEHYSCEDFEDEITQCGLKTKKKNTKQLLALILKCYSYLSDEFIDKIAAAAGFDNKKLKEMIEDVRKKRTERDNQLYFLKERIHCQYYRCIVYEKRLADASEDTTIHYGLKIQLEKARKRLKNMKRRLSRIRTDASNREVAEVIGVSKGAVDSCLFTLRNKWEALAKKAMLN